MASELQGLCIGQHQPTLLVLSRLDDDCTPLTGANDQVRMACFASVDSQPQYDDGQEFYRRAANGTRCFYVRDCDRFKQIDLTIQTIGWDMEMIELATNSSLLVGATGGAREGDSIGFALPGSDADCPNGVSVEVYTNTAFGTGGLCAPAELDKPPYIRHLWPYTNLRMGQTTLDDSTDGILLNLSGFGLANPNWGDGPASDWPAEGGMPASSPYAAVFADFLPSAECGYIDPDITS